MKNVIEAANQEHGSQPGIPVEEHHMKNGNKEYYFPVKPGVVGPDVANHIHRNTKSRLLQLGDTSATIAVQGMLGGQKRVTCQTQDGMARVIVHSK